MHWSEAMIPAGAGASREYSLLGSIDWGTRERRGADRSPHAAAHAAPNAHRHVGLVADQDPVFQDLLVVLYALCVELRLEKKPFISAVKKSSCAHACADFLRNVAVFIHKDPHIANAPPKVQ